MTIIVVNKTTKSETLMKIENVMIRNLVKVKKLLLLELALQVPLELLD